MMEKMKDKTSENKEQVVKSVRRGCEYKDFNVEIFLCTSD